MPLFILKVVEEFRLEEDLEVAADSEEEAQRMYEDGEVSTNIAIAEKINWRIKSVKQEALHE